MFKGLVGGEISAGIPNLRGSWVSKQSALEVTFNLVSRAPLSGDGNSLLDMAWNLDLFVAVNNGNHQPGNNPMSCSLPYPDGIAT